MFLGVFVSFVWLFFLYYVLIKKYIFLIFIFLRMFWLKQMLLLPQCLNILQIIRIQFEYSIKFEVLTFYFYFFNYLKCPGYEFSF